MSQDVRLNFRKGDFIAIGLVVVMAAGTILGYMPRGSAPEQANVQIYQDGRLVQEVPLGGSEERVLSVGDSYTNQITIRDGKVAITESDCPGTDCVYSGWISQPGRSIVCLPNRVEVRITGVSDVDFVVR